MNLAVRLFFGPAGAGNQEHLRIGANGLLVLLRGAKAADRSAQRWELNGDLFDFGSAGCARKGRVRSGVEQQEPWARIAADDRFNALAIEPAGGSDSFRAAQCGYMSIDKAAEAMGDAGGDACEARRAWCKDDGGVGCAAEGLAGGCVACIAGLRKGIARDGEQARTCFGQGRGCGCGVSSNNADGERGREARGKLQASGDSFERGAGEGGAGFVCMG